MQKVFTLISALLLVASLAGCKKKGGASSSPLAGEWKIVKAEGVAANANIGTTYIFEDDGTLIMKKGFIKSKSKYTVKGNVINIIWKSGMKMQATYAIKNGKLHYKLSNQSFVMEKQ